MCFSCISAALKKLSVNFSYLCIAQVFRILPKIIIRMACAYIKCMQSVCGTDTAGWTELSYPLATPTSYWRPLYLSKIQYNSVLGFFLSPILNENFVSIYHHEDYFKNGTFLVKNQFSCSRLSHHDFFRENDGKMSQILQPKDVENS